MVGRDVFKVVYSGASTSPSCPQVIFQALLKHVQKCGTHDFWEIPVLSSALCHGKSLRI